MNSCILIAKIARRPELRYTQDNQTPYAQMLVEFEATRAEDPPIPLKAVAWGNLAAEVAQKYNEGDQVILEGRLSMQTIDRPEGFKEKRAELTFFRIYRFDGTVSSDENAAPAVAPKEKVVAMDSYERKSKTVEKAPASTKTDENEFSYDSSYELSNPTLQPVSTSIEENLDDIPF